MEDRHQQLEDLFLGARALPPGERAAFLARECAGNPELQREVEELLAFDLTMAEQLVPAPFAAVAPRQIGPYRIVRVLSAGGMGTVYQATQQVPQRTVAVKTVRHGFLSPDVLRRFRAEIEILARVRHPGIAQIYDAGMDGEGAAATPYFAMEYIPDAEPITDWVRRRHLPRARTLELFAEVCDALHHAHLQGVIHRDLKPANILVSASQATPLPKIIDFGIARVTDLATMATTAGQLLGTLQYMSPEQLAGETQSLSPRSDVYALGLLLHELLAGKPPYAVAGLSLPDAIQLLSRQDPPRLGAIDPVFRGDIETIVGKALEKDVSRRYAGAAELAADIRRHLADEPILAHPTSGVYRARKFARRNRVLIGGVAATILALVAGLVASLLFAAAESRARRLVERQAYASRLLAVGSAVEQWKFDTALDLLDRTPERLRGWEWRHLRQRADQRPRELDLTCEISHAFAIASDGATYVTSCDDGQLHVWDAGDGHSVRTIALPGVAESLFVRGERVAAVGGSENRPEWLGVWNLRSGEQSSLLPRIAPDDLILDVDRDGSTAVTADARRIAVRDVASGRPLAERTIREPVEAADWSDDGRRLAIGFTSGRVELVDPHTLAPLATLHADFSKLDKVRLDRSGERLAATSTDGMVQFWPAIGALGASTLILQGRETPVHDLAFARDGSTLAVAFGHAVRLWSTVDGRLRKELVGPANPVGLAFRPDDQHVVVGSSKGQAQLWDMTAIELPALRGHASYVYPVAISPDGALILSGGWDGFAGQPGCLRVWDAASGDPVAAIGAAPWIVRAAAISPAGDVAAVAASAPPQNVVWLVDLRTGAVRELIPPEENWVEALAFDREGRRLGAAAVTGLVRILEVDSGKVVLERRVGTAHKWHNQPRLAWSHDGQVIAVGVEHTSIELWDGLEYRPYRRLEGHTDSVRALAFSPDDRLLASGSKDKTVRVWDVASGRPAAELLGHDQEVLAVAFSPDGKRLASGGHDAKVRLWDTATWDQVAELGGHDWYIYALAWSPDGERLVSSSGDGTVLIWDTEPAAARQRAHVARQEMLSRVTPMVTRWLDEPGPSGAAVERLNDASLSAREREIAWQVLLRESLLRRR